MFIAIFCGIASGALGGLIFLFPALVPEFSPIEQTIGRYLAYGLIALLMALPNAKSLASRLNRADVITLIILSLSGNIAYYFFLAIGIQLAGIAPTALISGLLPITITVFGARFDPRSETPGWRQWIGPLLIIAVGIICINADALLQAAAIDRPSWSVVIGLLAATAALAAWTHFAIANANYLRRSQRFNSYEWNTLTGLMTGALTLALLPIAIAWRALQPLDPLPSIVSSTRPWGLFIALSLALGLLASIVGAACWNVASRRLPIAIAGQLITSEILFALIYGFVWQSRWPSPLELAAMLLLGIGVSWGVRRQTNRLSAPHPAKISLAKVVN